MKNKLFFPMFVDLSDKQAVVVGGGSIATRRVKTLLQFTRKVRVVAPSMTRELVDLGRAGKLQIVMRPVVKEDLEDAYLVIAATSDHRVNDDIYRICRSEGIYVNVADDKDKCDFYFPGVYIQDQVVVGITASGEDHRKARDVRIAIEQALSQASGEDSHEV